MSAIAGILYFDGAPVEPGLIEKLTTAMKRRGPDEQTHWVQGSVALGHCMLRTTPESLEEHQPLISEDKNLVLVWDGRLDNRYELRHNLISAGAILRDDSDAELALQSFAIWGDASPQRLLGDFAFAVWDLRQSRLFCARDHMGARPFYYTRNDRFFAFASEDEVLTQLPGVSSRPNEERIAYFLVPGFEDFDFTHSWLEDVWSLMPAQTMTVAPDGASRVETYWQLQPGDEVQYASDEECQEAFLNVFGEAVRCRMRTLGSVSAMMSGGLDSAAIAATVKRLLPEMPGKAFHTYSAISDHPETCVESQCIQSLTGNLGDRAHFVSVPSFTGMLCVQDLIETAWSYPHPVDNSILLPAMMCLAASRDGQRVMLHGVSGDLTTDVPNSYPAFMLRRGRWRDAWRECRAAGLNNNYLRGHSPYVLLLKNILAAYAPVGIKRLARMLRTRRTESVLEQSLINSTLARKLKVVERMRRRSLEAGSTTDSLQVQHVYTLQEPHGIASGLAGYERVAGRYGVELRDPWADRRLVEFFLRLPLQYKIRNGWTKHLVRTAFKKDLSAQVLWRLGKEHLGWECVCHLLDETNDLVSQTLENGTGAVTQYMDTQSIHESYAKYRLAKNDVDRQKVYDTMVLTMWCQRTSFHGSHVV